MVRWLTAYGCDVSLVYKKLNHGARLRDLVRDACTLRIACRVEDANEFLQVDPFFNYCGGLRQQSDINAIEAGERGERGASFRRLLVILASPLSIMRDIACTPCYVWAALTRLKEPCDVAIGFVAYGHRDCAKLLMQLGGREHLREARQRLDSAESIAQRLGMQRVCYEVELLRDELSTVRRLGASRKKRDGARR